MTKQQGPRGAGPVVDTHAHWFPQEWVRLVEKEGASCGATITRNGDDRVVHGSDYCFDMGHEEPVHNVERWTHVAASDRDLILGGNAVRMLKLG